jgi:hypothetical protein
LVKQHAHTVAVESSQNTDTTAGIVELIKGQALLTKVLEQQQQQQLQLAKRVARSATFPSQNWLRRPLGNDA